MKEGHSDHADHKESKDHRDLLATRDRAARQACLDNLDLRVYLDPRVHLDRRDLRENEDHLVTRVNKVRPSVQFCSLSHRTHKTFDDLMMTQSSDKTFINGCMSFEAVDVL